MAEKNQPVVLLQWEAWPEMPGSCETHPTICSGRKENSQQHPNAQNSIQSYQTRRLTTGQKTQVAMDPILQLWSSKEPSQ